ncbi:uncharacterized protein tlr8a [Neosynchiropus ocellatus]
MDHLSGSPQNADSSNTLLFFLWFSAWPATANWTSPTFPCDVVRHNNDSAIIFFCNARSLEEVPSGITSNATALVLSDNLIKNISAKDLSHLYNLTSLKLNWANRDRRLVISKDAFKNLTQLRNLSLGGNHLRGIPTNLPAGLRTLDLNRNNITYLNKRMLAGLANITTLKLYKNCFYANPCDKRVTIEDGSFSKMTQLTTLDISFNNLTKVPKGLPESLVHVRLGSNQIQAINEEDFRNLTKLSELFLQGNCPRCGPAPYPCVPCQNQSLRIHPNAFQNLTRLNTLHLGGNSLRCVEPSWFENLHDLKVLILSFNLLLPVISSEAKFLTYLHRLESLDLSYNFEPAAFPPIVNLSKNFSHLKSLQVFHLPGLVFQQIGPESLKPLYDLKNLTFLNLGTNFLIRYESQVFSHFSHVKVLYLAENRLSPLNEQIQLGSGHGHNRTSPFRNLHHSRDINFMESHHFIKQECLDAGRVLSLSSNNLFFITPQQFEGYDDVACLNLSGNGFSMAPNGTEFSSLPNLTYLDLSYNKVDLAYNSSFRELQKLEVLDLSYNPHYFEAYAVTHNLNFLKYLPVLRVLNMSHNSIATLTTKQMSSRSLAELQFGNNGLGQIWKTHFQSYNMLFTNLTNLTILDISFNGIKNIPDEVLQHFPRTLTKLSLSNNLLTKFQWEKLKQFEQLQVLNLGYNSLTHVVGIQSHSLTFLDLAHNKIFRLDDGFLSGAPSLKTLSLIKNCLTTINQSSFETKPKIETLMIHQNPLQCTCDSLEYIQWMKSGDIKIPKLAWDVKCGRPPNQKGKLLTHFETNKCVNDSLAFLMYIWSTSFTLLFMLVATVSHLFYWDAFYALHYVRAKLKGYRKLNSKHNVYDVFVTYDTTDADVSEWVMTNLRPQLEDDGDYLPLCLEERDWPAGVPLVDNLVQSIRYSRKTLFVLTQGYVKTGVFRLAMYLAHQRLLEENEDVIVLLMLEPVLQYSHLLRLRERLCGKSVVRWPKTPAAEPWFWQNLRSVVRVDNEVMYNKTYSKYFNSGSHDVARSVAREALGQRVEDSSNTLLFFLWFSAWPATANWTSPTFPCEVVRHNNDSAIIFFCNARSLEEVPSGITSNATALVLSDNLIKNISAKDLSHLYNLTSLKLNWVNREGRLVISKDAFKNLTQLRNLSLGGNYLRGIPTNLPAGLRTLDLNHNKITYLNKRMLAGLANITTLKLYKNCFYANPCDQRVTIEDDSFSKMTQLTTLDISSNNLTKVPKGLPESLVHVRLASNRLQAINKEDFRNLTKLSVLFLQGNCPRCGPAPYPCVPCQNQSLRIHPNAFQNLTKLEVLHLGGNSLTCVEPSWFENLHDLKVLILSFNLLLPVISSEAKFLTYLHRLESLDLSYNFDPAAFPPIVNLSENFSHLKSLQVFHLPGLVFQQIGPETLKPLYDLKNLTFLNLGTNFLIRYESQVFSHFSHVKVLYLAENRLSPLNEQIQLGSGHGHNRTSPFRNLHHSRDINFMESHHFIKQECLDAGRVLSLSSNNLFFITPQQFEGYDDVACLNLSGNGFSMAPNGTEFSSVPNLTYLDLSYNKVDLAYNSSFRELQKLEVLDLSYNPHYFEAYGVTHNLNFLKYLPVLGVLNMSHNSIATLTTKQMSSRSLAELQFGNNGLGQIWKTHDRSYDMLFTNLTNLTILDISFNGIKNIPDEVLQHFPRTLTKLSLSNNLLTKFQWEKLKQFEQLQVLNLGYNSLTHVVGIQSHSLTFLDLAHNNIFQLDDGFLSGAPSLKTLSLIKNCLTTINQSSFETKPKIETLMIHQNPLQCTCDSLDFILWIERSDIKIPKLTWDVKCDSPANQKGKLLTHFETNKCVNDSLAFLMYIWSTSFTLLFMLVATVSHLFYWDAFYALHYVRAKLKGYRKLNSKHNVYDVFVTYDTTDADVSEWVMTNLRPQLEDDGDYLPLCLEERDWPAGVPLVDNLVQSIRYSRKTLFVLTQGYVKTGVFRLAMYLAHQRLLEENEDVIVLLMLEPVLQYSHLLRLRERLCGKSVVRWPKTPAAEPWFWQNLRSVVRVDNEVMYNKTYSKYFNSR